MKVKKMLAFGEFIATEKTFEDAVDDLEVLEKLWAKAAWIYVQVLVNGIEKMSIDFWHQLERELSWFGLEPNIFEIVLNTVVHWLFKSPIDPGPTGA